MLLQRWVTASTYLCLLLALVFTNFALSEDVLPEDDPEEAVTAVRTVVHQIAGVVALTDANFEHETQASTGQTTGSWLVWFHAPSHDSVAFVGTVPNEDDWSELHTVMASVNVEGGGRETFERLQVPSIPSFVYIHKGKMYAYPTRSSAPAYSWPEIVTFCQDPSQVSPALDVPKPPTFFDVVRAKVTSDPSNMMLIGGVVMIVVLGLFLTAVAGHFGSKASEDKPKVA